MADPASPLPLAGGAGGGPVDGAPQNKPSPNPSPGSEADPEGQREGDWLRFRDDAPADEPAVSLDAFLVQDEAVSVRIEAGEDVEQLIPHLARVRLVEIDFPKFRDGRGFSTARILREAGYSGEIKATGQVLVDLLLFMRRCGFDSFASEVPLDRDEVEAALGRYPHVYQHAADGMVPIWKLRHG